MSIPKRFLGGFEPFFAGEKMLKVNDVPRKTLVKKNGCSRLHFACAKFGMSSRRSIYLITFGKPAGHRKVAPREFDVHSRWKPATEAEEKRREEEDKAVRTY